MPRGVDLNGYGYVPAPDDRMLLARAIFAEGSSTPRDMAAIAWAIVNRVGHPKFPDTLYGVIHDPGQYSFAPESSSTGQWSEQWQRSGTPEKLTSRDAASWQNALVVANGVLDGSILDPTGAATYYFASKKYKGTWQTAPRAFWRMIQDNRLAPSSYESTYSESSRSGKNFFFKLNPESAWHSNQGR